MSYCRFSSVCEDGRTSEVYVIRHVEAPEDKQLVCYCVSWLERGESFDAAGMITHLEEHRAKGDAVPEYALERLRKELTGRPRYCVTCDWQIGKRGTYTGCYREVDGWVCVFCLSRFVEVTTGNKW